MHRFRRSGLQLGQIIADEPYHLLLGPEHQYPDGFALFLGTMFAPVKDRDVPGQGFTHKRNDIVTIEAAKLGKLINRMRPSDECEAWTFGIGALMKSLAGRRFG
jgi:fumarylacetoacetate (FAA) hydrolase family protein